MENGKNNEKLNNKDLKYWAALNHFPKFGPARFKRLKNAFNKMECAFGARASDLIKAGIEETIANEFIAAKTNIHPDKIMESLLNQGIKIMLLDDNDYFSKLAEIYDPPPLLYYKGQVKTEDEYGIAVVGSRKYSGYGKQAVDHIVKELAQKNITIISGLALGIDALAHLACLEVGGRTIAVLGSGLSQQSIYPSSNRYLADKIISNGGLLISEFPPHAPPLRHHFPQRNRIISGLSLGSLIIEAAESSGALITARFALEQNRDVFALPGNIYSNTSKGTNKLIKQGAQVVTSASDILEALDLSQVNAYIVNKKIIPESEEEEIVLSHLSEEPLHINELVQLTKLDTAKINSTLTLMEMKGVVKNLGNMQYIIAR